MEGLTGRYFTVPLAHGGQETFSVHVLSAAMQLFSDTPYRDSKIYLAGFRDLNWPMGRQELPKDPRTIIQHLQLDPVTRSYVCCSKCYERSADAECTAVCCL